MRICDWSAVFVLGLMLSGCPEGAGPGGDAGDGDGDGDADAGVDAGVDAGYTGPDFEVEDGFFPAEGPHQMPEACGQSEFRWWGVSTLGDLSISEDKGDFSLDVVTGFKNLLSQQGVANIQRDPVFATELYRVRYQTQDKGSLTEATGMIAYPATPGEYPTLLYMHGTAGFDDGCAPSSNIDGFLAPNYTNAATVALFASYGYVVVAPDYLGMASVGEEAEDLHAYLVGQPVALSSLDMVRASHNLLTQLDNGVAGGPVHVLGVSQGGHAGAFVVRYAPHYAPELEVASAVLAVPPLDLVGEGEAALADVNPTGLGNAAVSTVGLFNWYGSAGSLDEALLDPYGEQTTTWMESSCRVPDYDVPVTDVYTPEIIAGDYPETWTCYQRENSLLYTSIPDADDTPLMVITAQNDALVSTATERLAVETLCASGKRIEYLECAGAQHVAGFLWGIDDAFNFFEARVAGEALSEDLCTITAPTTCSSTP